MILINEWLPDPEGRDTEGEWIELANNGEKTADISGWSLSAPNGSRYVFGSARIEAGGYMVIARKESRLALTNENGSIILMDENGAETDRASFIGRAVSGKSWNRGGEGFAWSPPTPGSPNSAVAVSPEEEYPLHVPLAAGPHPVHILSLALLAGIIAAAVAVFAIKKSNELQKLFFQAN